MKTITEVWNQKRGNNYKYKTTDYSIKYGKNNTCTVFIHASGDPKKEPKDWIRNFMGKPVLADLGGKHQVFVHKGFYEAFLELKEDLLPRIEKYQNINIWGMSHGSALCILLHTYLKLNTSKNIQTEYLFGCPRVFSFINYRGFKEVQEICKGIRTVRLGKDIVPTLPYVWMSYGSVGEETRLSIHEKKKTLKEKLLAGFIDHGGYVQYFKES